jgi:hypothetical protein
MEFKRECEENEKDQDTQEENEKEIDSKFDHLPYVIKLKYPLKVGKRKIEEISILRRLRAKDVANVQPNNVTFGAITDLIAAISEESIGIIRELDIADLAQASEAITYFLSDFQVTGDRNS